MAINRKNPVLIINEDQDSKRNKSVICYITKSFLHPFLCTLNLFIEEFLTDTLFSITYLGLI